MIVLIHSLDSSLINARNRSNLRALGIRYGVFLNFDDVALLTQDTRNFTEYLSGVLHVPCAASRYNTIRRIITQFRYFRWCYFLLSSFYWMTRNRKKVTLVISENVDSPVPLLFSILYKIPYVIHYHYNLSLQLRAINKNPFLSFIILALERFTFRKATAVWSTSPHLLEKAE